MKELWVEKWRPKTVDGYVFIDEAQKQQVQNWVRDRTIPHLLLSGPAGTGKTTLAKILINELGVDQYDVLYVNGSQEGRRIEWFREKLENFCSTMPFGTFKIVLIDEADYLNQHSVQPAMRNLMEDYSETVRFILTCNYPRKIIPPLHSRCQGFHIAKTDHTEFTTRVAGILLEESVQFDLDVLDSYVAATYPDLRKCLNLVQLNSQSGTLIPPGQADRSQNDWRLECVDLIKQGKIREARTVICQQGEIDDADEIFRWMYDNLELWGNDPETQDRAILIIRNGLINHPLSADPEINLAATIVELAQLK